MKNPTHPVGDRKSNASFWVTENQCTLLGGAKTNQTHPCGWSARRWLVVGGDVEKKGVSGVVALMALVRRSLAGKGERAKDMRGDEEGGSGGLGL
ncbi:hypothetical protein Tco_0548623 [Tanacetum coccineum]